MTSTTNFRLILASRAQQRRGALAVASCVIDGTRVGGIEVHRTGDESTMLFWPFCSDAVMQGKVPDEELLRNLLSESTSRMQEFYRGETPWLKRI